MDLNNLSIWPKIRVFSAGVWHNLILSLFCYILRENRDLMLTPLYSTHRGFVQGYAFFDFRKTRFCDTVQFPISRRPKSRRKGKNSLKVVVSLYRISEI